MKKLILAWFLLISFTLAAAGTMRLEGTVVSFSSDTVDINDTKNVYTIDRRKVLERGQVASLKMGESVTVTIPFDAVLKIKPSSKQTK